jgi:hypothetical protein
VTDDLVDSNPMLFMLHHHYSPKRWIAENAGVGPGVVGGVGLGLMGLFPGVGSGVGPGVGPGVKGSIGTGVGAGVVPATLVKQARLFGLPEVLQKKPPVGQHAASPCLPQTFPSSTLAGHDVGGVVGSVIGSGVAGVGHRTASFWLLSSYTPTVA